MNRNSRTSFLRRAIFATLGVSNSLAVLVGLLANRRVVDVEVTALAHSFRIVVAISVGAFVCQALATIQMVAVIAHAFRIVLLVLVRTVRDLFLLSLSFDGRCLIGILLPSNNICLLALLQGCSDLIG